MRMDAAMPRYREESPVHKRHARSAVRWEAASESTAASLGRGGDKTMASTRSQSCASRGCESPDSGHSGQGQDQDVSLSLDSRILSCLTTKLLRVRPPLPPSNGSLRAAGVQHVSAAERVLGVPEVICLLEPEVLRRARRSGHSETSLDLCPDRLQTLRYLVRALRLGAALWALCCGTALARGPARRWAAPVPVPVPAAARRQPRRGCARGARWPRRERARTRRCGSLIRALVSQRVSLVCARLQPAHADGSPACAVCRMPSGAGSSVRWATARRSAAAALTTTARRCAR
jgi:hypothetical protein